MWCLARPHEVRGYGEEFGIVGNHRLARKAYRCLPLAGNCPSFQLPWVGCRNGAAGRQAGWRR